MTTTLLTNAILIDPEAGTETPGSLLIGEGRILATGAEAEARAATHVLDCGGKYLAPGIVDIGVKVCEPGERAQGKLWPPPGALPPQAGVTTIVTRPDTDPAIDNPETLEFVTRRAREAAPVRVLPMAALTKGRAGREMTEIGFLKDAGAVAFTDCDRGGDRYQGAATGSDLCPRPGRAGAGPYPGTGPLGGRLRHLGQIRRAEGPLGSLAHGRTDGHRPRCLAAGDDPARATTSTR